jgi:DNA-binding transcriptional LysR family regulator
METDCSRSGGKAARNCQPSDSAEVACAPASADCAAFVLGVGKGGAPGVDTLSVAGRLQGHRDPARVCGRCVRRWRRTPCHIAAALCAPAHTRKSRRGGARGSRVKQYCASPPALGSLVNLFWMPAQLAVLARVVDLNGFSAAARALGVPKAAVSRAIADLEKTLGVRVLQRTTRRLALTSAGQLVYPHARRLVEETEAARTQIARLRAPASGPLRVAADAAYGRALLAPLVPRFLESFPEVPLEVSLHSGRLDDSCDVAICSGLPDSADIAHRLLGAPPAILCATPAYLLERGVPARPDDLRAHDLMAPDAAGPEVRLELARGSQRAEVRLAAKLAVNDPAVLHAATAAGLGVGLLPEFLCRQGLATGRLKLVLADWRLPPATPLYAVYRATLGADVRVQRFVDFLAANIVPALAQA